MICLGPTQRRGSLEKKDGRSEEEVGNARLEQCQGGATSRGTRVAPSVEKAGEGILPRSPRKDRPHSTPTLAPETGFRTPAPSTGSH